MTIGARDKIVSDKDFPLIVFDFSTPDQCFEGEGFAMKKKRLLCSQMASVHNGFDTSAQITDQSSLNGSFPSGLTSLVSLSNRLIVLIFHQ